MIENRPDGSRKVSHEFASVGAGTTSSLGSPAGFGPTASWRWNVTSRRDRTRRRPGPGSSAEDWRAIRTSVIAPRASIASPTGGGEAGGARGGRGLGLEGEEDLGVDGRLARGPGGLAGDGDLGHHPRAVDFLAKLDELALERIALDPGVAQEGPAPRAGGSARCRPGGRPGPGGARPGGGRTPAGPGCRTRSRSTAAPRPARGRRGARSSGRGRPPPALRAAGGPSSGRDPRGRARCRSTDRTVAATLPNPPSSAARSTKIVCRVASTCLGGPLRGIDHVAGDLDDPDPVGAHHPRPGRRVPDHVPLGEPIAVGQVGDPWPYSLGSSPPGSPGPVPARPTRGRVRSEWPVVGGPWSVKAGARAWAFVLCLHGPRTTDLPLADRAGPASLPLQRTDQAEVLVGELGLLGQAEGEGGDDLIAAGPGDQIVMPEDARVTLPALDLDAL